MDVLKKMLTHFHEKQSHKCVEEILLHHFNALPHIVVAAIVKFWAKKHL